MPLAIASLITIIISLICYFLNKYLSINPVIKEIIFGIFFGLSSIYATQFGSMEIENAALNCRDAAPICGGLIFGPYAGIIAGFIGGLYRYFSSFWGVGVYTQYACTFATILAGFLTAICKITFFKKNNPTALHAFVIVLLLESIHVSLIPAFKYYDIEQAIFVTVSCAIPLLLSNSISVVLSFIFIEIIRHKEKNGTIKHLITKQSLFSKKDLFFSFQFWLLLIIVSSFFTNTLLTSFIYRQSTLQEIQNYAQSELDSFCNIIDNDRQTKGYEDIDYAISVIEQWNLTKQTATNADFNYAIIDNQMNVLNKETDYPDINTIINKIPENELTSQYLYNSTTNKKESIFVYSTKFNNYTIIIYALEKYVMFFPYTATTITAAIQIVIFSLLMLAVFILLKKLVGVNLDKINFKLNEITKGNLDEIIDVYSHKEFTQLSKNINSTVDNLKKYIDKEANRYKEDFELAKQIQISVLPRNFPAYPNRTDFDLYANYQSAKEIGGDFYDFNLLDNNKLFFLIADVSGKGIPAALFMMRAKTAIRAYVNQNPNPGEVFNVINNYLCKNNEADMFVTAWAGIINLQNGIIEYVNAGHNPPIVIRQDNKNKYLKGKVNFVLGAFPNIKYQTQIFKLYKNESILLYTDGITEANNIKQELYGEKRLLDCTEISSNNPKEICSTIYSDVEKFINNQEQSDDMTMLTISLYNSNIRSISNKSAKEWEYSTSSKIENVNSISKFVENILTKENINKKQQMKIDVAIDEIFSNIVHYGYKNDKGFVTVNIQIGTNKINNKQYLQLQFIDNAKYFNPLKYAEPDITLSAKERNIGGLGIFMTRKLMDEMYYEYKHHSNVLTLIKYLDTN